MRAHQPVRIGIVGHGRWAPVLARNLVATPGAELIVVCDHHAERVEAARERWGVEGTAEAAALFERDDIDAIVIATPIATHYELALGALQAGKHVLVEKPAATTVEQVRRLTQVAESGDRRLMVDHTLLFTEEVRASPARQRLRARRINAGDGREDVLWDLAVHDVAVFEHLFEGPAVSVQAEGAEVVRGEVRYADGLGAFEVGWGTERIREWDIGGPSSPIEPVARVCAEFIAAIAENRAPLSDGAFALRVTRILEALDASRRSGREIAL